MAQKHTVQEIAADPELWAEYIDPHGNAPFDDFTQGQREEIVFQSFGADFNDDGTPINTHGGPNRGQGRKPLDSSDPTESHSMTAPASVWRTLETVGEGNYSAGLRRVVAAYGFGAAITAVSPDDGLPVDDADLYLDPETISIVDGVGHGMFRDRATGRAVGMAQFDPADMQNLRMEDGE